MLQRRDILNQRSCRCFLLNKDFSYCNAVLLRSLLTGEQEKPIVGFWRVLGALPHWRRSLSPITLQGRGHLNFIWQIKRWRLPGAEWLTQDHTLKNGADRGLQPTTLTSRFQMLSPSRVSSAQARRSRVGESGGVSVVYTYVEECGISAVERREEVCLHGYAEPEQNIIHQLL